jgi:hypothetical protein
VAVAVADQEDNQDTLGKILPSSVVRPHHLTVENMAVVEVVEEPTADAVALAATE